jgi:hypothetical protein
MSAEQNWKAASGDSETVACAGCGEPMVEFAGVVRRGPDTDAPFVAWLVAHHNHRQVHLLVALDALTDGPGIKPAVWLVARRKAGRLKVQVCEKLGDVREEETCDREEALAHPRREGFLRVARFLIDHEPRIQRFLHRGEMPLCEAA